MNQTIKPDPNYLQWVSVKHEYRKGNPGPLTEYVRENPLMQPEQREFVADILSGKYDRRHDRDIEDRYGLLALKLRADQKGLDDKGFREFLVEFFASSPSADPADPEFDPKFDPEQKADSAMRRIERHYERENERIRADYGNKSNR